MKGNIDEVKKMEDGRIAVRWEGKKKKFNIINDPVIAEYLIYWIAKGDQHQSQVMGPL